MLIRPETTADCPLLSGGKSCRILELDHAHSTQCVGLDHEYCPLNEEELIEIESPYVEEDE